MTEAKITKDDIRAKIDQLTTTVEAPIVDAKETAKKAAVGGVIVLVLLAFLFGRRRGRKRRTIVEIKRV